MRGLLLLGVLSVACDDAPADVRAPIIESVRPLAGARPGVPLTVLGRNFGLRGPEDRLTYGGRDLQVESWGDRELLLRMPDDIGPGVGQLVVRSGARVSAPFLYEVLAPLDAGDGGDASDAGDAGVVMDADVGDFTP